jgi:hypothetical protein
MILKGHDRGTGVPFKVGVACQQNQSNHRWALQAAEKLPQATIFKGFVTGPDFSRADKAN